MASQERTKPGEVDPVHDVVSGGHQTTAQGSPVVDATAPAKALHEEAWTPNSTVPGSGSGDPGTDGSGISRAIETSSGPASTTPFAGGLDAHPHAIPEENRQVGSDRYSLTRKYAKGGIGEVWLAHDHNLEREVALKRLQSPHAGSASMKARFLREAWITGQLQHPGIVPVFELSNGSEGDDPFYTMRFIEGRTLSQAASECHRLRKAGLPYQMELQELLGAFLGVCHVVAYAHSRGVIHRDLKGQNVVLGSFGEVMVLDWGLAKVEGLADLEPELDSRLDKDSSSLMRARMAVPNEFDSDETDPGTIMGTPGFMSPEQAAGKLELVGPRSDVYGLGAILYEILTGELPFRGSKGEILRQVVFEDPQPPRFRVPGIPRGLDALCTTCLARKLEDRYHSASDLAKDVQRSLAGEPVSVYQEPWTARLRRWAAKHRTLVTASAATMLVATVCLAVAAVLLNLANRRETVARNDAVANFKLALGTVEKFFTKVGDDQRLKAHALEKLRRDLLMEAKNFYETIARDDSKNPGVGAERGLSHVRLAKITEDLGEYEEAVQLSRTANSIFEQLLVREPSTAEYLEGLARASDALGGCLEKNNQLPEARKAFEKSAATWELLTRQHSKLSDYRYPTALTLNRMARFLRISLLDVPESDKVVTRSLALCEQLLAEHPGTETYLDAQAEAMLLLGFSYSFSDFDKAQGYLDRALEIREGLAARNPESLEIQASLVQTCVFVASAYSNLRKSERVRQVNQNIQRISERVAREHPDVTTFVENHALIESLSAVNTANCGDHAEGTAAVEKALKLAPTAGRVLLYGACCFATASEVASRDKALTDPERSALVLRYQDRAMELLRATRATGLFEQPYLSQGIRADPDLAPLLPRKDYQEFLRSIEGSAPH